MNYETLLRICQVGGILSAALFAYGAYYFSIKVDEQKDAIKAMSGTIVQSKIERLLDFDGSKSGEFTKWEIGDSGVITSDERDMDSLRQHFKTDMIIFKENDTLKVSGSVRSSDGKLVAKLYGNDWSINPNNCFDRNYDKNSLEVIDQNGDVVLQVSLHENRVRLQLKLYTEDGHFVAFASRGPGLGAEMGLTKKGQDIKGVDVKIKPMFKYPSETYIGKRI